MATTTRILDANVNGTVYTSNANSALEALDTCHSGATAPTDEVANGKLWLDTSTTPGILKIYNNATWEVVQSGTADINGGTIDGTVIGGTTPAAVTGTTLTATGAFTSLGIDDNAAATAVTIDASGNVGIGIASPSAALEVSTAATTNTLRVSNSSGSKYGEIYTDTNGVMIVDANADATGGAPNLRFKVSGTDRMTIDSSGVFYVGKATTAFGTLGSYISPGGAVGFSGATTPLSLNRVAGTTGEIASFWYNTSQKGSITVTGSATAYNTSSDYRLKENITPVQGAADIVKAMQPVTYTFKSDGSWHDGFLAHELQELHPRAVIGEKDAMKDEEYEVTPAVEATYDAEGVELTPAVPAVMGTRSVPDYQGVDYSKLTPILTAALQEALNKIDALEARVAALEP